MHYPFLSFFLSFLSQSSSQIPLVFFSRFSHCRAERADVIGQSYVAVYNAAEFYDDDQPHDPFFLLGHGQALDLVTRLPVGGAAAENL